MVPEEALPRGARQQVGGQPVLAAGPPGPRGWPGEHWPGGTKQDNGRGWEQESKVSPGVFSQKGFTRSAVMCLIPPHHESDLTHHGPLGLPTSTRKLGTPRSAAQAGTAFWWKWVLQSPGWGVRRIAGQAQCDQSARTVVVVGNVGTEIKFTWLSQGWQCGG